MVGARAEPQRLCAGRIDLQIRDAPLTPAPRSSPRRLDDSDSEIDHWTGMDHY